MSRLQRTFEIGKGLHELSRIFARQGMDGVPRTQIPDQAREEPFDRTHCLKCKVCDVMAHATDKMPYFVPQICA